MVITQIQTLDSKASVRTSYSNTESITLKIDCFNDIDVPTIYFDFYILGTDGMQRFHHTGNSMVGKIGQGGSELRNIPISSFYSTPGEYTFRAEVKAGAQTLSQTSKFSIQSANISLSYPPDKAQDIPSNSLIFRWVASGATKYRVYVADNASFYKLSWTGDSIMTEIAYPAEPTDPLAKLASGTVYWWKVEGLDLTDKIVATTPSPFSFTVKTTVTNIKDLCVKDISLALLSTNDNLQVDVFIQNLGSQAESNVSVDLSVPGGQPVPAQILNSIQSNETKSITFSCGNVSDSKITLSANINIFDDNPKNNSLTKMIQIPEPKAKIMGIVSDASTGKHIQGAVVEYKGPANGIVETNDGGQYKIDDLLFGEYKLLASHPDYADPDPKTVNIEKNKAYPNFNFALKQKGKKELLMEDIWAAVQKLITDKNVVKQFDDYGMKEVSLQPSGNLEELLKKIDSGKVTLIEYKVTETE